MNTPKQPINLSNLYAYFGTLQPLEYRIDVLLEVKGNGHIKLDMEQFNNETLTYEEFVNQYASIVNKVEPV